MSGGEQAASRAVKAEQKDLARKWFAKMKDVLVPAPIDGDPYRTVKVKELTSPDFATDDGVWWNDYQGSTHLTRWPEVAEDVAPRRFA